MTTLIKLKKKYREKKIDGGGKKASGGSNPSRSLTLGEGLWAQFRDKTPGLYKEELEKQRATERHKVLMITETGKKRWRWED